MALDVLDHHDGVVHNQPCRKRNAKQCERIDREPEDLDKGEGADQRDRDGDRGNNGRAPVLQEQEDHSDDDEDGLADGDLDLADGVADHRRGIDCDDALHAGREGLLQLRQDGPAAFVHVQRVGIGELLHADADSLAGVLAIGETKIGAVVLRAQIGVAHVLQQDQAAQRCAALEDDVVELVRIAQPADHAHGHLVALPRVGRWLAKLARGHFHVLLRQRVGHVQRR